MGPDPQGVHADAQPLGKAAPRVDTLSPAVPIVVDDQRALSGRQPVHARFEAAKALFLVVGLDRARRRDHLKAIERFTPPFLLFQGFEQHQTGHTVTVRTRVAKSFALIHLSHDAVQRLVRVFVRELAAAPLEKPEQPGSNLLVPFGGERAIGVERGKKPVERDRGEMPSGLGRDIAHGPAIRLSRQGPIRRRIVAY